MWSGGGTSEMSVLLLLGAVTSVAGLALIATGATIHDGAFAPEILTPGMIAAVGGLLLIGMGLVVRELRHVERVLAMRPISRPARSREALAAPSPEAREAPARVPFPAKPKPVPAQHAAAAVADDAAFETLEAALPTWARPGNSHLVPEADVSEIPPPAPAGGAVKEEVEEEKEIAAVAGGANGGGPPRAVSQLEAKARLSGSPGRAKGRVLNAFWPVGSRRDVQSAVAAAQIAGPNSQPAIAPVPLHETPPEPPPAAEPAAAAPVSILKSGVIEGMAYTLYSDGSIEAQLPHGTLRFGSIAALREHIESKS
jgi:hypothetical protein